jgi:hypothetical protein
VVEKIGFVFREENVQVVVAWCAEQAVEALVGADLA